MTNSLYFYQQAVLSMYFSVTVGRYVTTIFISITLGSVNYVYRRISIANVNNCECEQLEPFKTQMFDILQPQLLQDPLEHSHFPRSRLSFHVKRLT